MASEGIESIFSDILERAKVLDPVNSRKWFDKLRVLHLNGGLLEISCPDDSTADYLDKHCKSSFTRAGQQRTGHLITIDFKVDGQL